MQRFFITLVIVFILYSIFYIPIFMYEKRRDKVFRLLAKKFNLQLTYDYKKYSYWYLARENEIYNIRTLVGRVNGKLVIIQDHIKPLIIVSNRLLPYWFWMLHYFIAPVSIFGWGFETTITIDGNKKDIKKKRFWSIVSLVSSEQIESVFQSLL